MPEDILQIVNASWPFLLMMVIFYFLFYRPQKKEQKKRNDLLNSLKKGERVITAGGVYGTITALTEKTVTLKVAEKVEIEFSRSAISSFQNPNKGSDK
ncbi:MAG: preprotein translocase subunit YajC [Negativicutes bacterium]|nr:preprotein translocase subunit YajC [Negativicutes bacterium]